ncbi:cilia- and flagella-associated protein 221-like [Hylaeus volcanicus]|uniref:cilia- and flagella-associated protein 221-like n=1 Tax=Hylaeus volcanicus TaxID=313075 RepID=UPI0023B7E9FB|nr:cilia- and flagella-associated protein 221-like [Hylaeus volcanicus]
MDVDAIDRSECLANKKVLDNIEEDSKHGSLSVAPSNLKFTFYSGNLEVQEKTIEITNYFSKPCPIQLLPLKTHYFQIRTASQRRWLSPGSSFKIHIFFTPDEERNYNDILKIHYFNNQQLQIKITAEITTRFSFPTNVNFGAVPLGRAACYEIPIYSHAKKKISFAIMPSKEDSCVDIYPRWGHIIPGQEPLIIMVIYRPFRYISFNFQIRIFITDLCKVPHIINFYAYTRPGILRETLENIESKTKNKVKPAKTDAISRKKVTPISVNQNTPKACAEKSTVKMSSCEESLLKKCSYFPLYALHAVNCIMNSKTLKSHGEHELKGPLNVYMSQMIETKVLKLKEFLIKTENYHRENELAKFHHKPKVNYGTRGINDNRIIEIQVQREQGWNDYKDSMNLSCEEDVFERKEIEKIKQRILRTSQKYPKAVSTSSEKGQSCLHYSNNVLFLQSARKIILKNRLLKVLGKLRQLTPELVVELEKPFTKY